MTALNGLVPTSRLCVSLPEAGAIRASQCFSERGLDKWYKHMVYPTWVSFPGGSLKAKEQVAGTSRRKSMRTEASLKAPAPIGERSPIAPARRLPRSPAKTGETFCSAPRRGACHAPSIGAPAPMAIGRGVAPVPPSPAISCERPPKPARLFSALRAAGCAAAPALEPPTAMAVGRGIAPAPGVTPKSETGNLSTLAGKGAAGEEETGKERSSVSVFQRVQGQGRGADEGL